MGFSTKEVAPGAFSKGVLLGCPPETVEGPIVLFAPESAEAFGVRGFGLPAAQFGKAAADGGVVLFFACLDPGVDPCCRRLAVSRIVAGSAVFCRLM